MIAVVLAAGCAAHADEPRLLARAAKGTVPTGTVSHVDIEGFRGPVTLRPGSPGEIRFKCRGRIVEVVESRGTARVRPAAEQLRISSVLDIRVPPEVSVRLAASDSKITAAGLRGDFELSGERLHVDLRNLGGDLVLDVTSGDIAIEGAASGVSLRTTDVEASLRSVAGKAFLALAGGSVRLDGAGGEVEGDLDGTPLVANDVEGPLHLRARGGRAEISDLRGEADLHLAGTPLKLVRCRGDVDVQTDALVEFADSDALLHVDSYGGAVRGIGNRGLIEVKTHDAEISLTDVDGPLRLEGGQLKVVLRRAHGDLSVDATASELVLDGAGGTVFLRNDAGDIRVNEAFGAVEIESRSGEVHVLGLSGSIDLVADGEVAEVIWTTVPRDRGSTIRNKGGDVTLRFPADAASRVEAQSTFGRVQSDLSQVPVLEGGTRAEGNLGGAADALIRVLSRGDIYLLGGRARSPAP